MKIKLKKNLFIGLVAGIFIIAVIVIFLVKAFAPFACGDSVTFAYNGSSVTYGTVVGADGKCWFDRNLGATQVATSETDTAAYGDYYQWGRGADGHQIVKIDNKVNTQGSSDTPGHANFIYSFTDWRKPANDALWSGVNGINNPCPTGWRLPTQAEWTALTSYFNPQTSAGAYSSALKLPLAGYRNYSNAALVDQNSYGYYWSSDPAGIYASDLFFGVAKSSVNPAINYYRAYGFSVRCVKDIN